MAPVAEQGHANILPDPPITPGPVSVTMPERYILGHAGKGAHAGYGKRWFETLKAAVEVIPNPLEGSVSEEPIRQ